ncbi:hypothetical protein STENM327S_05248 [Streptomyces tendae]
MLVNVFGGITACDEVANGIVQALKLLEDRGEKVEKPLVVRLDGNNAELGRKILTDANRIPLVQRVDTMDGAGRQGRPSWPRAASPPLRTRTPTRPWRSGSTRTARSSSRA